MSTPLVQCPVCRQPFQQSSNSVNTTELTCVGGHAFPFSNGVPDLVPRAVLEQTDSVSEGKRHEREWHDEFAVPEHDFPLVLDRRQIFQWLNYYQLYDLEKVLHAASPARILVGMCGPGFELDFWATFTKDVSGVDISTGLAALSARRAKALGLTGEFVGGDIEHLPFKDRTFDLVVVHHGLHHLQSLDRALGEMLRVSRDLCLVCEPVDGPARRWLRRTKISADVEPFGTDVYDVSEDDVRRIASANEAKLVLARRFLYKRIAHSRPTTLHKWVNALRIPTLLSGPVWAFNVLFGRWVGTKGTFLIKRRTE